MANSYVTSGALQVYSSGTTTASVDVGSSAHRYIFFQADTTITAVSYAGVSLTKLTTYTPTSTGGATVPPAVSIWGLANPTSGSNTLSITGTTQDYYAGGLYAVYAGVDPAQPASYNTAQTPASPGNVYFASLTSTLTTTTNNSWVVNFFQGSDVNGHNVVTPSVGVMRTYVAKGTYGPGGHTLFDSNAAVSPAGDYSFTGSTSSGTSQISAVSYELKPYLTFGFTGPASGNVNSASTNFTVTPDIAVTGTITVTPLDAFGNATISPITLTFANSTTPQTFTITPTVAGVYTLTFVSSCGLNNPTPLSYTANAVVPSAPTIGTASPLNASASVAFSAPSTNGGTVITGYRAISTPGSFIGTGTTSPITVSGLTNGTAYTFTVRATNSVGNSAESSASNSVTPFVPASTFTLTGPSSGNVRAASTNFTVTPNSTYDGTITITPSGIGSTGLSPVTLTWASSSAAQTFTITPTTSGAITLTPTNSKSITNPANLTYTANAVVPTAPGIGHASKGNGYADVSVSIPSNDGGAAITLYTVTSSPAGGTGTVVSPGVVRVLGLTNGTSYTFTATCTNSVGVSAASGASNAIIPNADSTNFTNSGPKFSLTPGVGELLQF